MDELKLLLNTRFMKNIITKILAKAIYKKTGYQIDIQLNEVKAEVHDGKVSIHVNADAEMNSEDLIDILKKKDVM